MTKVLLQGQILVKTSTFKTSTLICDSFDIFFIISGGCPVGYNLNNGDIAGWGYIGRFYENTISRCAKRCNDDPDCCSFEYSPTDRSCCNKQNVRTNCNLNYYCNPNGEMFLDYMFCTHQRRNKARS